ncbi:MAG: hypothetical protein ACLUHE_17150 [Christensenellales bacterium]
MRWTRRRVLSGEDAHCAAYIERHAAQIKPQTGVQTGAKLSIEEAIAKGLRDEYGGGCARAAGKPCLRLTWWNRS